MSKIALAPNGSGTGTFTLASPNSNTNRTFTLPDSDGELSTSNPIKAWVTFDGTGTVSIIGSFNVSSITDNGIGQYTANFATNMADTNFAAVASAGHSDTTSAAARIPMVMGVRSVSQQTLLVRTLANGNIDVNSFSLAIFR
tara:strand:+ start:780 stop:1205 length:426 start_codon:yes stop_codon:yes gene_type:complete